MQCACVILSSVACPALQSFFFTYFTKGTILERRLLNIKCLFRFSLQILPELFLILRRNERDMIKKVYRSSCKVLCYFCRVLMRLEFSRQLLKKYIEISNLMKILPMGVELFNADEQTDKTKPIVAFRSFANAPSNERTPGFSILSSG
jgi:hypothetical protein